MNALASIEMPQHLSRARIYRFEGLRVIAKENQSCPCCHCSAARMPGSGLRISPRRLICSEFVGQQKLLAAISGTVFDAGGVIRLAFRKFLRFEKEEIAFVQSQKIKKMSGRVVRRRVPICGPVESRADASALRRWFDLRSNRPPAHVNSFRPIQPFDKRNGGEEFAV